MPYSSHRKHSATSQQTMPFPDSRFVFDKRKTIHYHHLKFKIVIKRVEKRSVWYIWLRRQLNDRIMCANGALPVAQWPACIGWLSWMFLALYQSAKSLFSSFAQCFFSVLICVWSLFICFLVFFSSFWFLWQWRCRFATVYLFINKTVLSLPVRSDAVHKQWISSCLSHRKTAFTDKSISTSRELERSSLIPFVGSRFFLSCFCFNCENRKTNNFN